MIRCLIDEDSFDLYEGIHPHADLEKLSSHLELVAVLLKENDVLDLPEEFAIVVTCNPELLPWSSPGQHNAASQTVYLSGVYTFKELARFLAHELIHVEQTHLGFLTYDPAEHALCWFGVPLMRDEPPTYEEYRALPWEREAWTREPQVFAALKGIIEDEQCLNDMAVTRNARHASGSLH